MGIRTAMGNAFLALENYKNWPEVLLSIATRREPARVILKNGLQIQAAEHLKFLVREIFFMKMYNPSNLPIAENDIVVDIGAHNGIFTLFAASITKNMVYAFEPAPASFAFLKRNIETNKLNNVRAYNAAVSSKVGSAKLFLSSESDWQHMLVEQINPEKVEEYKLSFPLPGSEKAEQCVDVPTTTLQEIMDSSQLEQIDFLKMDCQGSEGPILQSTPRQYLKRVRKIAMEFHNQLSNFDNIDIQKMLEEADFTTALKWDSQSSSEGFLYAWRS
jgi:FkbM family methyltransferase